MTARLGLLPLACLFCIPPPVRAADAEFDEIVADLESRDGVHRARVPFLGFATFLAGGAARPFGMKDFRLAILERDFRSRPAWSLNRLPPPWRPVVIVNERRNVNYTAIYGRDEGDWVKMLVFAADGRNLTVSQFKLRPTALLHYVTASARR